MNKGDNIYTDDEAEMLVAAFESGVPETEIAKILNKTPGSVSWKLRALKVSARGTGGSTHRLFDNQRAMARFGDLRFKRAMLKAIAAGLETVEPMVIRHRVTTYVRVVNPSTESGYRSSAGYTADQAIDIGGFGKNF